MSNWTVHLEFAEGTSSEFWRARVEGKTLYVNYGKLGSNGQTQAKDFADPGSARQEYAKLVAEKRKQGYVDAVTAGAIDDEELEQDDNVTGDEDEDEAPRVHPASTTALPPVAAPPRPLGERFVLESGNRKVEAYLLIDGKTVRMEAVETCASLDAAKKAHDRLKEQLLGEGYKKE
jgi:predicted DNA-binding WGR domain protein